jgi:hypothetical protein
LPVDKIDFEAINDLIILGQVKEWSLGPITQETIDALPDSVRARLVSALNQLYGGQSPLPSSGGGS